VWDVQTNELKLFSLPESSNLETGKSSTGYERGIRMLAFASESTLYTAGDGGLRRWDLETGSNTLVQSTLPGSWMMWGTNNAKGDAVTFEWTQEKGCARELLHDFTTGASQEMKAFGRCGSWTPTGVALDASGTVAAIGSADGIVRVGRVSGGEPHLLVGHKGPVDRVAISPDLRWVATTGEDNTLRLWPMPDLTRPPLHTLPHEELLVKLRSLTNLRAVRDQSSATGWKIEVGPFPGWKEVPTW
jgi:WD40 repeat protein